MTINPQNEVANIDVSHKTMANDKLSSVIAELVRNGAIEFSGGDLRQIDEAKDFLPFGMSVYIPSLPKAPLLSNINRLRALHEAGFDPIPHIAARRIASKDELQQFLHQAVTECGVHRVLLIGGDIDEPVGPYTDSTSILNEGILPDSGIREVGIAGYPEGHARIATQVLQGALEQKLDIAAKSSLNIYVVTQFSFAPTRIVDYCVQLARYAPELPVYVGMAGPTTTANLIRYAKLCGVSATIRGLGSMGFKAVQLLTHTDPEEQLIMLAHYCKAHENCNVIGAHLFSFGGFVETAKYLQKYLQQGS